MQGLTTPQNKMSVRLVRAALLCLLIAFLLEFVLCNRERLFSYSASSYAELDPSEYCRDEIYENGSYTLMPSQSGDGSITFEDVPGGLYSVSFEIGYTDPEVKDLLPAPTVKVTATDPRTTWQSGGFITVITEQIAVGENGAFRSVTLYASVKSEQAGNLRITFEDLGGTVELRSLRLNTPPSWGFHPLRFLLIALLFCIPAFLSVAGLFYRAYDPKNVRHRHGAKTAVLFTLLLAILFVSMVFYENEPIAYPLDGAIRNYQPYIQQFDAFMKGQLHLDVPVSDEMLGLENPYDYDSRVDASPLWDRAYYEGSYYSYFGVTPILVVYFPYYLLTGSLPSDSFVMTVFLLICAVFIPLTVLKWVDLHEKKALPLPIVWLGAVTAFVGSMMLLISRSVTPFYYIATIAASAFLSVFLYLLLKAAEASRFRDRLFFYAYAGLAYALLLHSRLNIALLAAFIVIPYLIFRVLKKRDDTAVPNEAAGPANTNSLLGRLRTLPERIRAFTAPPREIVFSLLALGTPVLIGLCAALALNAARFGSIFEFGTRYQLTVSDIRYNALSLGDLFPALYHYFFDTLQISYEFPFFSMHRIALSDYGHYVYTDTNFGLFSLPLMKALLLTPAVCFLKNRTRYEKVLAVCLVLGLVTVALLNFSLGGVIFRYVADLTTLGSLGAVFLVFAFFRAVTEETDAVAEAPTEDAAVSPKKKALTVCVILFFVFSCAVALLLSLSYNGNLTKYDSSTFAMLKDFFTFR